MSHLGGGWLKGTWTGVLCQQNAYECFWSETMFCTTWSTVEDLASIVQLSLENLKNNHS
jgi:hypothetical protein